MKRVWMMVTVVVLMLCAAIPATAATLVSANKNSPCAISPRQPTVSPVAKLNGRLGGTRASWDALYGPGDPTGNANAPVYVWKGCGAPTGPFFVLDRAVWVSLSALRPEVAKGGSMAKPSDAHWTYEEALHIARKLAPSDAVFEEPQPTPGENTLLLGTSVLLAEQVGWDVYGGANVAGPPGGFEIRFTLDAAGEVYAIDVALRGYTVD